MVKKQIKLVVLDSLARDVGRFRVRTTKVVMNELNIATGEILAIKGPRGVVAAYVWPDREQGEGGPYYIKMDRYLRENIGAKIGGYVYVSRLPSYPPPKAMKIHLVPKTGSAVLRYVSLKVDDIKMMLNTINRKQYCLSRCTGQENAVCCRQDRTAWRCCCFR